MIEETVQVVRTEGEFAWIEGRRQSTCGGCAANKACGTAALSKVLGQKRTRVRALNRAGAQAGDTVIIGIRENALVMGSLAVYAVPLLTLLVAALAGQALVGGDPETMSIVFGVLGLLLGFAWVRRFSRRISMDPRYQPVILRRLPGGGVPVA